MVKSGGGVAVTLFHIAGETQRGHMTGKGGLPQRPVTAVPALGLEEDPNPHLPIRSISLLLRVNMWAMPSDAQV